MCSEHISCDRHAHTERRLIIVSTTAARMVPIVRQVSLHLQDPSQCYASICLLVSLVVSFLLAVPPILSTRDTRLVELILPDFITLTVRGEARHYPLPPPLANSSLSHSPQYPVLRHPPSLFIPLCQGPTFTPIHNHNLQSFHRCTELALREGCEI
jgi:hypothetical protein